MKTRSALVVIDMQEGFVNDQSSFIVPTVSRIIEWWSGIRRPYVMTTFRNEEGSGYHRLMGWRAMAGPPETDIIAELQPAADQALAVTEKTGYSFFNSSAAGLVEQHGWTDLYITGIATEACVLKTAIDAFERGMTPWVVVDAVYSEAGSRAHQAGLVVLERCIGRSQLVRSEGIRAHLEQAHSKPDAPGTLTP